MRKTIAVLISFLFLAACSGSNEVVPLPTRAESANLNPRTLLVATPDLPPTWTPPPPIAPEHLPEVQEVVEVPVESDLPPYVVQAGDTLGEIATQFGVSLEALAAANGISNIDVIEVGMLLVIPNG